MVNLLTSDIFPVRLDNGSRIFVSFGELASVTDGDASPVAFDYADNLLNRGAEELCIGIAQCLLTPASEDEWFAVYESASLPPDSTKRLAEWPPYFDLFGKARAFQDRTASQAKLWPIERLAHGSPGDVTKKYNKDFLGGSFTTMGVSTAAVALATFQAHSPQGGPGFRTSIAGGGPLRVRPTVGGSLWQQIWACVLPQAEWDALGGVVSKRREDLLPWLDPKMEKITRAEWPASHLYFAIPRRFYLVEPTERGVCPFTGREEPLVSAVREAQNGPEYTNGGWEHPLVPYRTSKDAKVTARIPLLAASFPNGLAWRDNLGLVLDKTETDESQTFASQVVRKWRDERAADLLDGQPFRITAYGAQYSQAKFLAWVHSQQAVNLVPGALPAYQRALTRAVETAYLVSTRCLKWPLQDAFFSRSEQDSLRKGGKSDVMSTRVEPVVSAFWSNTSLTCDRYVAAVVSANDESEAAAALRDEAAWRFVRELGDVALKLFRDATRDLLLAQPERVVPAERAVEGVARRKDVLATIGLPLPEKKEAAAA